MKKLLFLFCAMLASCMATAQAPAFQWVNQVGDTAYDTGRYIGIDSSGNVYTAGWYSGSVDFDPGPGTFSLTSGSVDTYITKTSPAGNFIWAKSIAGSSGNYPKGLSIDAAGNVYLIGLFSGTVDVDPGPSSFTLHCISAHKGYFLKLDANGDFLWGHDFDGSGFYGCEGISTDAAGNIYATGNFLGTVDFDPGAGVSNMTTGSTGNIYVSKLTPNGTFVWARQFPFTAFAEAKSIVVSAGGDISVSGNFDTNIDLDPGPNTYSVTSAGSYDFFLIRLNTAGNFVWGKSFGNAYNSNAYCMRLTPANDLYITGNFHGTMDFDPGAGIHNVTSSSDDAYILKLNTTGDLVWVKTINGSSAYITCMASDQAGNFYASGLYGLHADFDPGIGVTSYTSTGNYDGFLLKLDPAGSFIWANTYGAPLSDGFSELVVDANNSIYVCGNFTGTVDFDASPAVNALSCGPNNPNAFLLKLGQDPPNGIKQNYTALQAYVYPNPATSILNISLTREFTLAENLKVSICDPLGKVVLEQLISANAAQLNIQHLPKGIYFLTVAEGGSVVTSKKIIKE